MKTPNSPASALTKQRWPVDPMARKERMVLAVLISCLVVAGTANALARLVSPAQRGVVTEVCFQPKSGRVAVDAGQGGALQAGLLPVVWQVRATAVVTSTQVGEPDSTCSLPLSDLPAAFQLQVENMIDTKLVPALRNQCNTP